MVLGVALANIFVDIAKQRYFWIILSVLSIIPFFILIIRLVIEKMKKNKPGSDRMDTRDFIDAFDNEIAYYILMSESYYTMLIEAVSYNNTHSEKVHKDMIHFYYIQASYYFNKTIDDLVPLFNIADKVISSDKDEIAGKKLISLPRYNNAKNLLATIFNYLDSHKYIMDDLDDGDIIVKLNEKFRDILESIDRAI